MRDNAFVLYYGPEAALLLRLCRSPRRRRRSPSTAPNRFESASTTATGGGIDHFYRRRGGHRASTWPAAQRPARTPRGLHNTGIRRRDSLQRGRQHPGPKLDLLEATPARVKLRQESFYQSRRRCRPRRSQGGRRPQPVRHRPDGAALGPPRRRARSPIRQPSSRQTCIHRRRRAARSAGPSTARAGRRLAPGPVRDDFIAGPERVGRTPGARTDFLNILYKDWTIANAHLASANLTSLGPSSPNAWRRDPAGTTIHRRAVPTARSRASAGTSSPTSSPRPITNHADAAVTSRSADYRGPGRALDVGGQPLDRRRRRHGRRRPTSTRPKAPTCYARPEPGPGADLPDRRDGRNAALLARSSRSGSGGPSRRRRSFG